MVPPPPGGGLGKASERVHIGTSLLAFLRKAQVLGDFAFRNWKRNDIDVTNHNDIVDILRADPVFFLVGATVNV